MSGIYLVLTIADIFKKFAYEKEDYIINLPMSFRLGNGQSMRRYGR